MSTPLIEALEESPPVEYIQSSVDDLHSFCWTGTWGTVFNPLALEGAGDAQISQVQRWRRALVDVSSGRFMALNQLSARAIPVNDHAPLVKKMSPLFRRWNDSLDDLLEQFLTAWKVLGLTPVQKLYIFYRYALEGVANYAELLIELQSTLTC